MTDYEKLKDIIDEIDILIEKHVSSSNADFQAWMTKAERFLIRKFGNDSLEHTKFKETHFSLTIFYLETPDSEFVEACRRGLETTKAVFLTYLEEIEEERVDTTPLKVYNPTYEKVFIVHGHDGELKEAVARIIEKQGISAIILSEQANKGRTIIEKFEDYSDVGGAICLFTADDYGRAKTNETDNTRARQNVVLETGYFMGKLGRDHVVLLADQNIEMPSDLSGVVYTDSANWAINLLKELKEMGYTVDLNKLF